MEKWQTRPRVSLRSCFSCELKWLGGWIIKNQNSKRPCFSPKQKWDPPKTRSPRGSPVLKLRCRRNWNHLVFFFHKVKLFSHVWLFETPRTVAYRLLHPWNFPGKSTGVGCHFLLQGIFPTQGSNLGLPHCRQTLYHLSHQGSPPPFFFIKQAFKQLTIYYLNFLFQMT